MYIFFGEKTIISCLYWIRKPDHPIHGIAVWKSILFLFDYVLGKESGNRLVLLVNLLFQLVLNKQEIGLYNMLGNYIFAYLSHQTSIQRTLVFNMLH